MIELLKKLLPLSPADCLMKKVDIERLEDALRAEEREFYGDSAQHSRNDYAVLLEKQEWKKFIGKMKQHDELWFFRYPEEYWRKLQGCQGYVIIRQGKLIDKIVTIRN